MGRRSTGALVLGPEPGLSADKSLTCAKRCEAVCVSLRVSVSFECVLFLQQNKCYASRFAPTRRLCTLHCRLYFICFQRKGNKYGFMREREMRQQPAASLLPLSRVSRVRASVLHLPGLSRDFDCFDFILEWDGMSGI